MEKQFTVHSPEQIPLLEDHRLQVSAWYFARIKTLGNETKNGLVAYDFKKSKWIFGRSGHSEIIEYYKN